MLFSLSLIDCTWKTIGVNDKEYDPEYFSEKDLADIKASLKDYAEGRFKSGSIADLINDLDT